MEQSVSFDSADGLRMSGAIHIPDDLEPGEQRPGFIVLHGFGSNSDAGNAIAPATMLCDWGYVTLRFDMRGCGKSDGEFGRIICLDQVEDTQHALSYFRDRPEVLEDRVGLIGSSFGAAVSLYTAGIDERAAAVVSAVAWGNGETKFRAQHSAPEAWVRFTGMLVAGAAHRKRTGESMMVSRYDIVPIPEHLRGHLATNSVMEFPVETAQSMLDFRAEDVVGRIAPRPLLLMHAAKDSVCPSSQSIELFRRAGPAIRVAFTGRRRSFHVRGRQRTRSRYSRRLVATLLSAVGDQTSAVHSYGSPALRVAIPRSWSARPAR